MNFFRKIFREGINGILFVLGLAISCFVLMNIGELVSRIQKEKNAYNKYKYNVECFVDEIETDSSCYQILKTHLNELDRGNLFVLTTAKIDNSSEKEANVILVMKQNEELLLDYNDKLNEDYANSVIIGESLLKYTKGNKDNRTITVYGEEMNVVAVLNNNTASGIDSSLYVLWDTCDGNVKNRI